MNYGLTFSLIILLMVAPSCVTKRTVKQGGRTVDEKIVIKRPIKNTIQNIEFE